MPAQLKRAKVSITLSVLILLSLMDTLFYTTPTVLQFLLQAKVVDAFSLCVSLRV